MGSTEDLASRGKTLRLGSRPLTHLVYIMGANSSKELDKSAYRPRKEVLSRIEEVDSRSELRRALEEDRAEELLKLSQAKAELSPPLEPHQSLLHYAVTHCKLQVAKIILRSPTVFPLMKHSRDKDGRTPLHLAVSRSSSEFVSLLLKYNSKPDIPDLNGITPRDLARCLTTPEACDILEQLTLEDVMRRVPAFSQSQISPQAGDKGHFSFSFRSSPPEPFSNGSKSTLHAHLGDMPQVGDTDTVICEDEIEQTDLEAAIHASCIPVISGAELRFGDLLNRGSSCEVLKGKWRGCEVAIKKFKPEYKENKKELCKFVKEMQTLARVRHPNLLLLMGICVDLSHLCLITEFVPNMSLFYALHSKNYSRKQGLSPYIGRPLPDSYSDLQGTELPSLLQSANRSQRFKA